MKDFFLPLYKKHFLMIKNGTQNCEIRPYKHRGWRAKNIYPGRFLLLSNGYGKHDRIRKRITRLSFTPSLEFEGVPQWHINAVEAIYGKRDRWLIAYF